MNIVWFSLILIDKLINVDDNSKSLTSHFGYEGIRETEF